MGSLGAGWDLAGRGFFSQHGEQALGHAAGVARAALPFGDGLLPRAEALCEGVLRLAAPLAQRTDSLGIPVAGQVAG